MLLRTRKSLVRQVAEGDLLGERIQRRIVSDQVSWVQNPKITKTKQGKHQKVWCMLDDESTQLIVREYISQGGQSKFIFHFLSYRFTKDR